MNSPRLNPKRFNWSLAAIVILVLASLALVVITHHKSDEEAFTRKSQCQSAGEDFHAQRQAEYLKPLSPPIFTYSDTLNTCLYLGGSIGESYTELWLADVLANQDLVTYTEGLGAVTVEGILCDNCPQTLEGFNRIKKELFGDA